MSRRIPKCSVLLLLFMLAGLVVVFGVCLWRFAPFITTLMVTMVAVVAPGLLSGYIWASDDKLALEFMVVLGGVLAAGLQVAAQLAGQYLLWVQFTGLTPLALVPPAIGATSFVLGAFVGQLDETGRSR